MSYPKLTSDDVSTLQLFFQYVDSDADGYISIDEIKTACAIDINGDSMISQTEIDIGAAPWLSTLIAQDLDGDTRVSFTELLQYNNDLK